MNLWEKLRDARNYFRKQRGPDSYFQYKRKRENQRREAEQVGERARGDAQRERGEADRGREFEERYAADRESDIAKEGRERAEEAEPDP